MFAHLHIRSKALPRCEQFWQLQQCSQCCQCTGNIPRALEVGLQHCRWLTQFAWIARPHNTSFELLHCKAFQDLANSSNTRPKFMTMAKINLAMILRSANSKRNYWSLKHMTLAIRNISEVFILFSFMLSDLPGLAWLGLAWSWSSNGADLGQIGWSWPGLAWAWLEPWSGGTEWHSM